MANFVAPGIQPNLFLSITGWGWNTIAVGTTHLETILRYLFPLNHLNLWACKIRKEKIQQIHDLFICTPFKGTLSTIILQAQSRQRCAASSALIPITQWVFLSRYSWSCKPRRHLWHLRWDLKHVFFEKGGTTRQTIKTNNRQGPNGTLPPALPLAASRVLHQTPLTFNATISGEWSLEMVQNHFSGLVGCDEGISRVVDIQFLFTEVVLNFRLLVFGLESQSLICSKVIPNHYADYGLERLRIAQLSIYTHIHIPKSQKTLFWKHGLFKDWHV